MWSAISDERRVYSLQLLLVLVNEVILGRLRWRYSASTREILPSASFPSLHSLSKDLRENIASTVLIFLRAFHFQRFQSKALRLIVDALRYVSNTVICRDLQIPTDKEEICRYSSQYSALLNTHSKDLVVNIMELPENRRLRRHLPNDLPIRFLV
jgi:hypothetical protein